MAVVQRVGFKPSIVLAMPTLHLPRKYFKKNLQVAEQACLLVYLEFTCTDICGPSRVLIATVPH